MPTYRERLDALLTQGTSSQAEPSTTTPSLPAIPSIPTVPAGFEVQGVTLGKSPSIRLGQTKARSQMTPEEEGQRKGIIAQVQERAKQAANIPSAIRSVKVHLDQFQSAFPSDNHSQALQAAIGISKNFGSRFGIGVTPQQQAVLKTLPLATIGLVRVSGALGRVTNQELDAASEALNQAGLTDETRLLVAKNLAQQYLARVDPKEFQVALKNNPDLADILNTFGVQPPGRTGGTSLAPDEDAIVKRLLGH